MNIFLSIFLFLFISAGIFGQNKNQNSELLKMSETDSLYFISIEKYIAEIGTFYKSKQQPKTIFIEYKEYLKEIPDSINGYKIQTIRYNIRKQVVKENKGEFVYVKILPLTIINGQFNITLIPYHAKYLKKNHLHLSLSSWTRVIFEFKDGRLNYKKTENDGI